VHVQQLSTRITLRKLRATAVAELENLCAQLGSVMNLMPKLRIRKTKKLRPLLVKIERALLVFTRWDN
jgi:hypothetical protein